MARRIIRFRNPHKPRMGGNALLVISAITAATAVFALAFVLIKFTGWTQSRPVYEGGPLRGVAIEDVLYVPPAADDSDVVLEKVPTGYSYAGKGQKDVNFLEFKITSRKKTNIRAMEFSLNGFARPYDVSGLQLYMDEKFIVEKPLFEGRAVFDGLNINLSNGQTAVFRVAGTISEQARASDRIQIGIRGANDLDIRGGLAGSVTVGGDFPVWGNYVSVIGDQLR